MLRLTTSADMGTRPPPLPDHMHLCGRDVLLMSTPLRDQTNWWWTCNPDFNPRFNTRNYSSDLLQMPHKIGADPRAKSDFPPKLMRPAQQRPSRQLPPVLPVLEPPQPEPCAPPPPEDSMKANWASNRTEWAAAEPSGLWSTDICPSTNPLTFSAAPAPRKHTLSVADVCGANFDHQMMNRFADPGRYNGVPASPIRRAGQQLLFRTNSHVRQDPRPPRMCTAPLRPNEYYSRPRGPPSRGGQGTRVMGPSSLGGHGSRQTLLPEDQALTLRRNRTPLVISVGPKKVKRFPASSF